MSDEKRLDERMRELARDYHDPPAAPRERMWERIATARHGEPIVVRPPWWRTRKVWWPTAAAAVLLLGIAIGRLSTPDEPGKMLAADGSGERVDPGIPVQVVDDPAATVVAGNHAPDRKAVYRFAAAPVLGKAELLLTQFQTGADAGGNGQGYSERARRLLQDTRLLLGSPAAEDPEFQRLLNDLELTLARVVQVADKQIEEERALVEDGLADQGLLPRLRSFAPAGRAKSSI